MYCVKPTVRALSIVGALACVASAQHSGDVPPALVWNKLTGNCPESLDWTSLRGKVVSVSLTAKDISPEDVDAWNEVAQNFQSGDLLFIQVVAGSEFLLDQALKQTAFHGCILFDAGFANHQNFKLPHFERSVVVDQLGFIAGYSRLGPDEEGIGSVLNHQSETALLEAPPQPETFNPAAGLDAMPSYELHISAAPRGERRSLGQGGPDQYISKNQPLKLIILDLWDTPLARIVFPEKLDEGNYDVSAHMPVADHELLRQTVREAVERHFGLRVQREERSERVYVLTHPDKPSSQLQPAMSTENWMCGSGQGSIIGTAQSMRDIARAFEGMLGVPVVDGTGLKGKYDYSASSKLSESEAAFDMAQQLGLELTQEERPIEMLVVRRLP